jgi:hypothetical protein
MANQGYKVLVDELTVHKGVRKITHPITGESLGWQNGNGETFFRDEVIPASDMNPDWVEALESGDEDNSLYVALSKKLEPVSDEPTLNEQARLGLPFAGFEDMEEDDILAAMKVLPSAAVTRIVEWEKSHDNRPRIATWNIGYGENTVDRQEGNVGGEPVAEEDQDQDKAVRALSTRETPDDGPVVPGEGVTGTGDPQIPYGSRAAEEESGGGGSGGKVTNSPRTRRSRRPRSGNGGGDTGASGGSSTTTE